MRGDDHINNTPRQINILRALGAEPPQYGHLPMILGPDGEKLSKRHGAVSVMEYDKQGYLPEAMINYLARLGWAHGDLSPYNVLVRDDEMVIIDWPQVVDIIGNPQGFEFLERDVRTMCAWFERRGLEVDADVLFGDCAALAAGR